MARLRRPGFIYVIAAALYFGIKFATFAFVGAAVGLYLGILLGAAAAMVFVLTTDHIRS